MSKMIDDLKQWIRKYRSGKIWLNKLRSQSTIRVYLPAFKRYSDLCGMNPDQILSLKLEGMRQVGSLKEFQAEETHDDIITNLKASAYVKGNISQAVVSFYKHNRRPLIEIKRFERPKAKKRRPSVQDIEEMSNVTTTLRDSALIWFVGSTALRDGTLPQLKWEDLKPTGDKEIPYVLDIEAQRLKGKGVGKYRNLRAITFIHWYAWQKLDSYRKEAKRKGIELTEKSPLFVAYTSNNNDKGNASLSRSRICTVFELASLNTWHNLKEKRFSPQDFRDFVDNALKKAKVVEVDRAPIMSHSIKGVEKHYQDPEHKDLLESYRSALPYLIPQHKQQLKKPQLQKVLEETHQQIERINLAHSRSIETVKAQLEATTDPKQRQLLEVLLLMFKEAKATIKQP